MTSDTFDQFTIGYAIHAFTENGDPEPLCRHIESGNPAVLRYPPAREILADLLRGNIKRRRGKPRTEAADNQKYAIRARLHFLKGKGVPVYGDYRDGKETGIEIVARDFHLSPETVKDIWKSQEECATFLAMEGVGREVADRSPKIPSWEDGGQ